MIMDRIALVLAIVGGINWGSVGLFRFDIVAWLFGGQTATVSRVNKCLNYGPGGYRLVLERMQGEAVDAEESQ